MWCAVCRADVAAELSADNRRMLCARCHAELGTAAGAMERPAAGLRTQETERSARELLARWSTQHLLEPPLVGSFPTTSGEPKQALRFDGAHAAVPAPVASPAATHADDARPERRRRKRTKKLEL